MRINILIGGKAGEGVNLISEFISKVMARSGFYIFNYREFRNLIKGHHNFNIICVGDEEINSFDESFDIVLDMDGETIDLHKKNIKKNAFIISINKKFKKKYKNFLFIESKGKFSNIFFASCLFKLFGIKKQQVINAVRKFIKKNVKENLEVVCECYSKIKLDFKFKLKKKKTKEVVSGSEAVGRGFIDANADLYLSYPMTPATPVLTYLSQKNKKFFVFVMEDEIAVINAALGASFGGARVMIGTSGGGFDLMTEGISMQGMTELPLVIYLAMRTGPSTGVPTYTSQADLNAALYSGHGEFTRVVFTPGDVSEAYELTKKAFEISEKYGVLSIILSDKHLAESYFTTNTKNWKKNIKKRKSFLGKIIYKTSSYEHTKEGYDSEEKIDIIIGNEKRINKKEKIMKDIEKISYEIYGKGENVIISFGSNKGAILDSLKGIKNFKFIHVKIIEPFSKKLCEEILKAKKIFVIEANASGQFSDLITKNTGRIIKKNERILKYDARPFTPSFIIKEIKKRK